MFGLSQYHGNSNEIAPHLGIVPQAVLGASLHLVTCSVFTFHTPPDVLTDGMKEILLIAPLLFAPTPYTLAAALVWVSVLVAAHFFP